MNPTISNHKSPTNVLVILSFASFIVLSFPAGLLGVAWPSIRDTFGVSLDSLGTLLLAGTIGHILTSFASGRLIGRIGLGPFLLFSTIIESVGLLGYALAPGWWGLVAVGVFSGAGAGAMDVGLNAYFAANHSPRLMNWLHASFGLGVTIGPVVMTAVLDQGQSWRWGYVVAFLLQTAVAVGYGLTLRRWRDVDLNAVRTSGAPPTNAAPGGNALKLAIVWLSMALFFMIAGTEATAGNWAFSLFTEERGVAVRAAGIWVSIYWGSFTLGRVVFGLIINKLKVVQLLRANMLLAAGGAWLIWWNPANVVSFLGLALTGFALAPLFPLLVSETPERVGRVLADRVIGFQIGTAGLGLALLPGFAGILAENISLEVIAPFLVAAAIIMFALHEMVLRNRN